LFDFLDYNESLYLFVPNCLHAHNFVGVYQSNQRNAMNLQIKAILGDQLAEVCSTTFGKEFGADARLHAGLT